MALFLGGEFPVNLAARGLLERLDEKDGFEDAKQNTSKYIEEVMAALGGGDDRFKTE